MAGAFDGDNSYKRSSLTFTRQKKIAFRIHSEKSRHHKMRRAMNSCMPAMYNKPQQLISEGLGGIMFSLSLFLPFLIDVIIIVGSVQRTQT